MKTLLLTIRQPSLGITNIIKIDIVLYIINITDITDIT
jgi:hypothetical protein